MTERIGYWENASNTEEGRKEVEAAEGMMTAEEHEAVLKYIEASEIVIRYKGFARCRACGKPVGSCDMLTPNKRFVFPQGYEHYITAHSVRSPEDFIKTAVEWNSK